MASKIIALTGLSGSGKSEVAKYLQYGHGFTPVKFAGPLKAMLEAFYRYCGVSDDAILRKLEGDLKETPCPYLCGRTPRYAMQTLGTEWGRQLIGGNLWTNSWFSAVDSVDGPVVTDDCRFPNEVEAIRIMNGAIVKMKAAVRRREDSDHVSEQELHDGYCDRIIENDGGIGHLRASIDDIMYPLSGNS